MLKQAVIVLLAAALCYWIFNISIALGAFRHVFNHSPGKCIPLSGIEDGSEDIESLPNGLAFISSDFNIDKNNPRGRIFLFDLNQPTKDPVQLKIVAEEKYKTLNPHGISLWTNQNTGVTYLYVVNHLPSGDAIDKFRFDATKDTLEHVRRIENDPNFHSINDLVVVAEDQFYFSNDHYFNIQLEFLLNLHWGSVGFFDGKRATLVETGLFLANGISVSKDQKTVYLAQSGHEEIRIYQKNADHSLSFLQSVSLKGTFPDNIDVDHETGDLWIGAHPSIIKFLRHFGDNKRVKSPSQILRIRLPSAGGSESSSSPEVTEVYSNDGQEIAGSSVAVRFKKGFLIGSVLDRALYCKL